MAIHLINGTYYEVVKNHKPDWKPEDLIETILTKKKVK